MAPSFLVWTGSNVAEMARFAEASSFAFVVGSPYHRYRWWHRAVNRLAPKLGLNRLWWSPRDDPQVLEIYPALGEALGWPGTTARPGDAVFRDGSVGRRP